MFKITATFEDAGGDEITLRVSEKEDLEKLAIDSAHFKDTVLLVTREQAGHLAKVLHRFAEEGVLAS
jgi:prephenate dehydratase